MPFGVEGQDEGINLYSPLPTPLDSGSRLRPTSSIHGVVSGTERQGSDIDLMVVGGVSFETLVAAVYPCQEKLGREINPNLFTPEEFESRMRETHSFVAQVMEKPKLMVLGREDDIRESSQSQKAGSAAG